MANTENMNSGAAPAADSVEQSRKSSWTDALAVYLQPRVLVMLFLGFSAGLPFLLAWTTLGVWLTERNIDKATIGYFSWVGITYSIKVFWAPIVDRVSLPLLTAAMGKRRSWMLLAQCGIAAGLLGIALSDPSANVERVAFFALLVAFSSATQDITIDAYRIEAMDIKYQAAMAATYQFGYRVALIVAGAGALYIAQFWSWPMAYFSMAACVLVGITTVLLIREPEHKTVPIAPLDSAPARIRVARNFLGIAALLGAVGLFGSFRADEILLRSVFVFLVVLAVFLAILSSSARAGRHPKVVGWFESSVVEPFVDFIRRFGPAAAVILVFVGLYRLSDISMGSMANPFYIDLHYTKAEIASVAKLYGVALTMIGTFVGGVMVARFGLSRPLLAGAILVSVTSLAFAWLATTSAEIYHLMITISADNFAAGFAGTVFIAFLSSLVSQKYTATQYALFSSLFTLPGKIVAGFSGQVVDHFGFFYFFIYVAALGLPAILMSWYFIYRPPKDRTAVPAHP